MGEVDLLVFEEGSADLPGAVDDAHLHEDAPPAGNVEVKVVAHGAHEQSSLLQQTEQQHRQVQRLRTQKNSR